MAVGPRLTDSTLPTFVTLVSILIPCLNEERYIEACLTSVLAFKIPPGLGIEVLVIDGQSRDATREIVQRLASNDSRVSMLENPGVIQSCAMNLGIRAAKGTWILRLDSHARYPDDYLWKCWETAQRTQADNVGGLFITQPGGNSYQSAVVQALTTHAFGVGNAGFRLGAQEGAADTVPYGFFRRDLTDRIGWFDERLVRCQDYEFNRRIIAAGGLVWRNPEIQVFYFNQPDLASFFRKQFVREAPYNPYMWYLAPYAFTYRHGITGLFALGVIGGSVLSPWFDWIRFVFLLTLGVYSILAVFSAWQQAIRYRNWMHLLVLPPCFFLYHFLHGLGVLKGIAMLAMGKAPVQHASQPWLGANRYRAYSVPK